MSVYQHINILYSTSIIVGCLRTRKIYMYLEVSLEDRTAFITFINLVMDLFHIIKLFLYTPGLLLNLINNFSPLSV